MHQIDSLSGLGTTIVSLLGFWLAMAVKVRDEPLLRSLMFLCLGTSAVLLLIQWRVWANGSTSASEQPTQNASAAEQPIQKQTSASAVKLASVAQPAIAPKTALASQAVLAESAAAANTNNLVVDLGDRRVYVYQGKRLKTSYPLAVGKNGWETPTGSFQVVEMQENPPWLHPITKEVVPPGPDNPLGKRWIGFWTDGQTHIGFHGTNQEEYIGQAVSHGCLRMRNQDVVALFDQVQEGTPVAVRR
jgi:L,D-transpeptidase ErfK/SrfK